MILFVLLILVGCPSPLLSSGQYTLTNSSGDTVSLHGGVPCYQAQVFEKRADLDAYLAEHELFSAQVVDVKGGRVFDVHQTRVTKTVARTETVLDHLHVDLQPRGAKP